MKRYIVVCEGDSERAYLQRLQSFLDGQPTDRWDVALKFIPAFTWNKNGRYGSAVKGYKEERKTSERTPIEIWVDFDLYQRNDNDNMTQYRRKPAGVPNFRFSFHNFEDFLVLHMEEPQAKAWLALLEPTGHFKTPLYARDYIPLFQKIVPGYCKGDLAPDFISRESLLRLKNSAQNPAIAPPFASQFKSFADFLIEQIEEAYPTLLSHA